MLGSTQCGKVSLWIIFLGYRPTAGEGTGGHYVAGNLDYTPVRTGV